MNFVNANKLIKCLIEDEHNFNMRLFFERHHNSSTNNGMYVKGCGTASCIAGHAIALHCEDGGELGEDYVQTVARYLDVSYSDADQLCIPDFYDPELIPYMWKHVPIDTFYSEITIADAITAIRSLMAHHGYVFNDTTSV